jgi:hypothetical protein
VTLCADVDHVVGPHAFVLDGDAFVDGKDLLVVTGGSLPAGPGRPAAASLRASDLVLLSGTVRTLDVPAAEKEIGADLDDGRLAEWAGTPAIVASAVTVTPRRDVPGATQGDDQNPALSAPLVPFDRILKNPDAFYGRIIRVAGVIRDAQGRLFTIDDAGVMFDDHLLALAPANAPLDAVHASQAVQVTGTLRAFDLPAFQRELGANVFPDTFANWNGRPVLVAQYVVQDPRASDSSRSVGGTPTASQDRR